MNGYRPLAAREIGSYFLSPVAYLTAVFFLVSVGFGFWFNINILKQGATAVEFLRAIHASAFVWISVLFAVPVITMRTFAEEKRNGTIETLMTAPVSDTAVVLAKYTGAMVFYIVMWLPTMAYPYVVNQFSSEPLALDAGAMAGSYLGGLLIGMMFVAAGVLFSALTSNQILAAIMTFAVLTMFFLAGFMVYVGPLPWMREHSGYFSAILHMFDFTKGVIDTRPVVFYLSSTAWLLFAAVKVVEARRWR